MVDSVLKVTSLFTGIGGMDMGFEGKVIVHKDSLMNNEFIKREYTIPEFVELKNNNFNIVFQNDIIEGAKEVYGYNNNNNNNTNYSTKSIYDLLKDNFNFPESDVVIGGFPCQDFSHCGKRGGFKSNKSHDLKSTINESKDNSRGTLYKCFVEVVKQVKPKVFVAENVYGLLTMDNNPIEDIIKDFSDAGYDVKYQVVYCPDFGIPQTRKRVIIMGIARNNRKTILQSDWNIITKNKATCCIGKYFNHLDEPNETADLSQQMYSKAKKLAKGQGQIEINMESFAPTMRAEHHGNIEFRRHENSKNNRIEKHLPERRLTVREAGLIQTFPPHYVFMKKKTMRAYKYIGNAVPPLLGYLIANKVNDLINDNF
jgi:DNA (cytosine-5)-methyltransferase 1